MQLTTAHLIVNPCDDEEDNMAMLCCHSDKGEMFMLTRYPDEDEVELTWDYEPSTLDGLKVTLGKTLLKIEIAAADADALNAMMCWRSLSIRPWWIWMRLSKP